MKRTQEDVEWTERRAQVGLGLAALIEDHGIEAVLAECSAFVAEQTNRREKRRWLEGEDEA